MLAELMLLFSAVGYCSLELSNESGYCYSTSCCSLRRAMAIRRFLKNLFAHFGGANGLLTFFLFVVSYQIGSGLTGFGEVAVSARMYG